MRYVSRDDAVFTGVRLRCVEKDNKSFGRDTSDVNKSRPGRMRGPLWVLTTLSSWSWLACRLIRVWAVWLLLFLPSFRPKLHFIAKDSKHPLAGLQIGGPAEFLSLKHINYKKLYF